MGDYLPWGHPGDSIHDASDRSPHAFGHIVAPKERFIVEVCAPVPGFIIGGCAGPDVGQDALGAAECAARIAHAAGPDGHAVQVGSVPEFIVFELSLIHI